MSKLIHLQTIFKKLSPEQQLTLLEFAEFLLSRTVEKPFIEAKLLPRLPSESVIAAIKRLSKSYPMLDKATMLDDTSRLMTEHIIQGREKSKVIDELEIIFSDHYKKYLKGLK
jgi:hypothetical protein